MRRALLVLTLAGCDLVFQLDENTPPVAGRCSRGDVLADDFEGAELASVWRVLETTAGNTLMLGDGRATLDMQDTNTAAAFESVPFFDFRGSTFQVDVTTAGNVGGPNDDGFVQFDLQFPNFVWSVNPARVEGDALVMRRSKDLLQAGRYDGGNFTSLANATVAATPLVWRIASEGDEVVWSISDDGATFTEINRLALDVGMVRPRMLGFLGNSAPFSATFDRFNGGGVATGQVCPSSVLSDGFDAPLDPNLWSESGSMICRFEAIGGELVMVTEPPGPQTNCFLRTGTIYDLYGGGIAIELEAAPDVGHAAELVIETATQLAGFSIDNQLATGTQLVGFGSIANASYLQKTYDPIAHKFLRFSAVRDAIGEQLLFEASADGETYELLGKTPDFTGLDRVRFRIQMSGNQNPAGTLVIQGVNAP